MKALTITIVTVCYNAHENIEKTIKSIVNQTYKHIEYIIIDGGSKDGTLDIIKKYSQHISLCISEPDNGIFDAMNKGLLRATGDYIIYINAGDFLYKTTTIEECVKQLTMFPLTDVLYGSTLFSSQKKYKLTHPKPFFLSRSSLKPMGICHQSLLVSTTIAKKYMFDLQYAYSADYAMIKNIYSNNGTFLEYKDIISIYDTNGISSVNTVGRLKDEAKICGIKINSYIYIKTLFILKIKSYIKTFLKLIK